MEPTPHSVAESAPPPARGRRRRVGRAIAAAALVVAILASGGVAFLGSEAGLRYVIAELIARTDGRLVVDAPEGSLLSTVRAKRLSWRGDGAVFVATDLALTWSPAALWSRGIVIHGLGAQRIEIDVAGAATDAALPANLALPVEVSVDRIAVGELAWTAGSGGGRVSGIAFGYDGGATRHRLRELTLVTEHGTVTGDATLGASAPFPVTGRMALAGDGALRDAQGEVALSGTLAELLAEAKGRLRDAPFTARATLAPLAPAPLKQLAITADAVDLNAWSPDLPATRMRVSVEAAAAAGGIEGKVDAANAMPGPLDAGRLPLAAASAGFAWQASTLVVRDLVVRADGGGSATGQARIPLADAAGAGEWSLQLRNVDLKRIHSSLVVTRLSGSLRADLGARVQRLTGDLADREVPGGLAVDFAAAVADDTIDIERLRARAGAGVLTGRGKFGYAGLRPFALEAAFRKLDPARYGAFPPGSLDGEIAADGVLSAQWRIRADVALTAGSRLAGVPLTGTARGEVAPGAVRAIAVDLAVGTGRLTASGATGEAADVLALTLDTPRLAELVPLLPAAVPRPLAGALRAEARLRGVRGGGGVTLDARAKDLRLGTELSAGTVDAKLALGAAAGGDGGAALAARSVDIGIGATAITSPRGPFARLRVNLAGTVGQHALDATLLGEALDARVRAQGGLREGRHADGTSALSWSGTVDTLENRGAWTLHLAAPAPLEFAPGRVRAGPARLAVADGNVDLAELAWDEGRLTTRGTFAGLPLSTATRLAGLTLPSHRR
jgi:translocation and assembly module TamB